MREKLHGIRPEQTTNRQSRLSRNISLDVVRYVGASRVRFECVSARAVDLGACVCVVHWQVEVTCGTVVVFRTY